MGRKDLLIWMEAYLVCISLQQLMAVRRRSTLGSINLEKQRIPPFHRYLFDNVVYHSLGE